MTHNTAIAGMADPVLRALTGTSASAAVQHVLINRGFDYIGEAYVLQGSSCSRRRSVGRESGVWIAKASLRSNDHLTVLNDFDDVDRTRGPRRANTCDLELDPGVFELLTSIVAVEFVLQFRACFGEVRSRFLKHSDDMDIERL